MAYIKIFPIKATVKKAVNYIMNPEKTDDGNLVSSFACSPETADLTFAMTAKMRKDNVMDKGDNLAWHMIISFKPKEISDPALAHEVGKKIADAILKEKYEYVLTTHHDKKHIHNHLIFNATSYVDYHKYVSNKRSYHKICSIANKICREYGLAESFPTGQKGLSYKENMEYKRGYSWKAKLKYAIDRAVWTSITYDEFLQKMKMAGYEIRMGKHISFRAPEQVHFTYMKSLGTYYSEENILNRLEKNRHKPRIPKDNTKIKMFIQMSAFIEKKDQPGFEKWAKLNNLKEAAKTFNYLSEHNLLRYEDYQNHGSDLEQSLAAVQEKVKETEKEFSNQQIIQKQCEVYRFCRNVILNEKTAPDKNEYRRKHKTEYEMHDITQKELLAHGISKLPSSQKLERQINQLEESLSNARKEYLRIEKEKSYFHIIQNNFNEMINSTLTDQDKSEIKLRSKIL